MTMPILPKLKYLPATLPLEGAVRIELEEGIPIFRASHQVQNRIEELLWKQRQSGLNELEELELDGYEDIDDYLSFVNRTIRNLNPSINEPGVWGCLAIRFLKQFNRRDDNERDTCVNIVMLRNNGSTSASRSITLFL